MGKATVKFYKCVQDSQDYGTDDSHMVSRVFFVLNVGGNEYDLHVDIKQSVGGQFENNPLEIGRPEDFKGPFNYQAFRDATEQYYRSLIGVHGGGIRIQGNSNVRMRGNILIQDMTFEFDVSDKNQGGW